MKDNAALAGDSAARHLLHNLRNAKALRLNPLVSHLFGQDEMHPGAEPLSDSVVISRVSQAVSAVLRTLTPAEGNPDGGRGFRQSEIIRRCVIGFEPYKAVARDLAISLRTLFRDLDEIRLRLVEELPHYAPPAATVALASDTFELQLRHAHVLRNAGHFAEALALLDRLAAEAASQLQRARAWNSSAIAFVDSGATEKAAHSVDVARTTLASADVEPHSPRTIVACDLDLTEAMIARVHGDSGLAMQRYDRAATLSLPVLIESPSDATDVYVRAQAQSAVLNWLTGRIAMSSDAVERAWNALERLPDPPETAHYHLLTASSLVHLVDDGDVAWAIREMSAAAVLAERHGMLHDALMALGWLSALERLGGNLPGAVQTGRRTLAIAHSTMTGTEFGLLSAAAAENEAAFGDIGRATALVAEARTRVEPGGSGWARLQLAEAEIFRVAGNNAAAIAAAQQAADAMQRQGKVGFAGTACLVKGLAHERRGERAQALLAAREALSLLEQFGKSPELIAAYELSARLTGNRRHRTAAVELIELFKR